MHLPHDAHCMGHPVPEIGVPDVLGAGVHLLVDVGEHHVPLHDFELTTDHGHGAETGQKLGVGRGVEAEEA